MTSYTGTWLLDTNVLLRTTMSASLDDFEVNHAVQALLIDEVRLFYTSQNFCEFWNVCTRPLLANGFGLSVAEADERALLLESRFWLAPDSEAVHVLWRKLIVDHQVYGIQVHDARIVVTMRANSIANLLTLNVKDFRRYDGIVATTPRELLR